jgi:beta-fructofuranosidase
LPDVVRGLRKGSSKKSFGGKTYSSSKVLEKQGSSSMELKAVVSSATGAVGVMVAASPDMKEYTTIIYEPSNNTLLVERAHSSLLKQFNTATVTGYFYPYSITSSDGTVAKESITMDVFLDGSLLEVYVNNRFALSTRIYPSMECSTGYGVYVSDGAKATFESVKVWDGLLNVWPERPKNSSSPLLYDTPKETDDYTWWTGN